MKMKMTAVLMLIAFAAPATAQDHASHGTGPMKEHMGAMYDMMESMAGTESSGNADADFLLMMIPHHQSAIDMAEIELEHGKDAKTREMAQQIIDAQKQEIAEMKEMLERLGVDAPE